MTTYPIAYSCYVIHAVCICIDLTAIVHKLRKLDCDAGAGAGTGNQRHVASREREPDLKPISFGSGDEGGAGAAKILP